MPWDAVWYFDFVSPYAYLQLAAMLRLRERLAITPKPVVFAALLKHHGQLGPAEIPAKRAFTYRFVHWRATRDGVPLRFPPAHPFNPLAALRLCVAAGSSWTAVETIFAHLWRDGQSGIDAAELTRVGEMLGIADVGGAIASDAVKATLRANTDEAIAAGVFGVPTLAVADQQFWGYDATAMIEDWLAEPSLFDGPEYARLAHLSYGQERRRPT